MASALRHAAALKRYGKKLVQHLVHRWALAEANNEMHAFYLSKQEKLLQVCTLWLVTFGCLW